MSERPDLETDLSMIIELVAPPIGVAFCLQKGRDQLLDQVVSIGKNILFEFPLRVKQGKHGAPNFLGSFAQGTAEKRFVYVCSGKRAGQIDSCWDRRAKIHLASISWSQIDIARSAPGARLKAGFYATSGDGGPSCATVPLLGNAWKITGR